VLDCVNRRDRFPMKKPLCSPARGASFHTKHASNVNVVQVVLLDANSYLAYVTESVKFGNNACGVRSVNFLLHTVYANDILNEYLIKINISFSTPNFMCSICVCYLIFSGN
jgi:hypothetical protein